MSKIEPFRIAVSDEAIADLHQRIDRTRWPDQVNDEDWSYGTDLEYLQELVNYWRHEFNWREQEAALNRFDQFTTEIDGLQLHFIHQRSSHADATPMIITHGWPGSVVEFMDIIEMLTEPEKHGGSADQAFHVVCASLPGFAFSSAAAVPGMNTRAMARLQVQLMALLGYDSYVAQGGDWGAVVTRQMADLDGEHCRAIHLNMVMAFPPADAADPLAGASEEEKQAQAEFAHFTQDGWGYYQQQSTRPQSLAYGLADSPVGLAGWLTEKFRDWSDCDGEIRNVISWDKLLTNISLYWFSNCIASSVRIYCEESRHYHHIPHIAVPTGVAIYPKEPVRPPRHWIEDSYRLVHYHRAPHGGHFAAMERPGQFVHNLREFKAVLDQQGLLS